MGFSYDNTLANDTDKIRFYLQDTESATAFFSDEELTALITLEGGYQPATIAALEAILAKINRRPDMTADWLRTAWGGSRDGLEKQLERLQQKWSAGYSRRGSRSAVTRYDTGSDSSD